IVIPPAIFFYYSTLFDSRFKTLQQNRTTFTLARLASVRTLAKIKSKKAYLWDTPTNRLLTFYTLGKSPIPYLALRAFFKIYSSVFKRGLGYTPRKYFISMWGTY
ncbi:hypothetical protein P6Z26_11635, partial [Enterococcus faecium]|uniref:hypothetical protein n=2 Tax=Enterococcus TaxID=1350 RepID=UPI0028903B90